MECRRSERAAFHLEVSKAAEKEEGGARLALSFLVESGPEVFGRPLATSWTLKMEM